MQKIIIFSLVLGFLGFSLPSHADDVKFVSTGEGDVTHSDEPDVDDPYMGKELKQRDLEGDPLTQQSYENCEGEHCKRAEERQTSEGTTWRDDVNSGLKPGGY